MPADMAEPRKDFKRRLALKNSLARETVSEFLGTFILIVLGCGCVAQTVLSRGSFGNIVTINVGFPMAVTMAIYVTGGVSGGHVNPAVSFAMCLFGRMKWFKLPFYVGAQFLGAFAGSAALFGIYYDGLMSFADGKLLITGENATAHIFATYPAPYLSVVNAFADQVMSTMFLLMLVFAIFDSRNLRVPKGLEPIVVGLLILVLSSSLGLNSGCAMNPARDLSPRLFTALAGWGFDVFRVGHHFWWIPVVGPLVGAALGGLVYMLLIEIHHPEPEQNFKAEPTEDNQEKYELSVIM
ncbi:PREDICTED: aquaporin-9 [Chinchilla lanigera]|uniref:Aquaporin 9 n=1 Tax=Chinchilla lanigera TaxID=34839 RepID=A0A8C2VBJ2_CHILA|nr:PREDICTED: aquaporin-9 [Chinchilla lanigera]XP_005393899.1 PREDICTED: aquaporin-9 [Chinchilla lanigera]XP_005393900.1 PREDICTED: aquaporin-9 [Chinchilla lanigera]XP_013374274.1 PREDICTED: aquaporin-9 [Chinchilla lanigera]